MPKETESSRKKAPPPPKKAGNIKKTIESKTSTGIVSLEAPASEGRGSNYLLRHLAENMYVHDRTGLSLSEIAKLPQFKDKVKPATIAQWRVRYNWVEKREKYFRGLSEEIKNKLANSQVQATLNLIESWDKVFNMALEEILSGNIKFATAEGAINALIRLGKSNNDLRAEITDKMVPEAGQFGRKKETTYEAPVLSHEEARVAALSVVIMRAKKGITQEEAIEKARNLINKSKEDNG